MEEKQAKPITPKAPIYIYINLEQEEEDRMRQVYFAMVDELREEDWSKYSYETLARICDILYGPEE